MDLQFSCTVKTEPTLSRCVACIYNDGPSVLEIRIMTMSRPNTSYSSFFVIFMCFRTQYFRNQLLTWKICIFACIFTASIAVGMVSFAFLSLLYFLATYKEEIGGSRPLLFPFWLPNVDFGETPVYEIAFMFSNICALLYAYNYICKFMFYDWSIVIISA